MQAGHAASWRRVRRAAGGELMCGAAAPKWRALENIQIFERPLGSELPLQKYMLLQAAWGARRACGGTTGLFALLAGGLHRAPAYLQLAQRKSHSLLVGQNFNGNFSHGLSGGREKMGGSHVT